jgi:hypothetical protein
MLIYVLYEYYINVKNSFEKSKKISYLSLDLSHLTFIALSGSSNELNATRSENIHNRVLSGPWIVLLFVLFFIN